MIGILLFIYKGGRTTLMYTPGGGGQTTLVYTLREGQPQRILFWGERTDNFSAYFREGTNNFSICLKGGGQP